MRVNHEISAGFIEQCKTKVYQRRIQLQRRHAFVKDAERELRQAERELKKWSGIRAQQQRAKRRKRAKK
jgi:flagellar biosynthesis chaperone FliJ